MNNIEIICILLCFQGSIALAWCWILSQRVMELEKFMYKYFDWNTHD